MVSVKPTWNFVHNFLVVSSFIFVRQTERTKTTQTDAGIIQVKFLEEIKNHSLWSSCLSEETGTFQCKCKCWCFDCKDLHISHHTSTGQQLTIHILGPTALLFSHFCKELPFETFGLVFIASYGKRSAWKLQQKSSVSSSKRKNGRSFSCRSEFKRQL